MDSVLKKTTRSRRHPERGMTLIELMIAGLILTIGLIAVMGVVALAITNDGRSKYEATAVMIDQQVIEHIHYKYAIPGDFNEKDCLGTQFTIDSSPGGAQLNASGDIDFTETSPPAGYHMNYAVCSNSSDNTVTTYDVRWHIDAVDGAYDTYQVTVAAKPVKSTNDARIFALPTSMHVVITGIYQ